MSYFKRNRGFSTLGVVVGVVVAIVVVVALVMSGGNDDNSGSQDQGDKAGSGFSQRGAVEVQDGVAFGKSRIIENWGPKLTIGAGQDQAGWLNNTGRTVYVSYTTMTTDGTASSTFRQYAISTTTSSVPDSTDFTALADSARAMIHGINIATSTTATTTNSVMAAAQSAGLGTIPVADGSYFISYIQAVDNAGCGASGACEQATSTNRGFTNLVTRFKFYWEQ